MVMKVSPMKKSVPERIDGTKIHGQLTTVLREQQQFIKYPTQYSEVTNTAQDFISFLHL